jgi:hypothetical protein
MIRNLIIILLAFIATGCNLSDSKPKKKKDFYNTIAGWDIKYIPIIPPFRASSIYPEQWLISAKELLHLGKNRMGAISVNSFGVSKNYVYGKTEDGQYFLFNVNSLLYSEYETDTELFETLKLFNIEKNQIETCENYFQQLRENKRCYWYPKESEKYPKFKDSQPDTVYTIIVNGEETVTDFEVKEKIKKTVSKIYSFKVKYDNEKNDLFYVSFDYSPPKLINNNKIFTAYSEDNTFLNISVYTPFLVAQNKGINEKDRIVIYRQIELK